MQDTDQNSAVNRRDFLRGSSMATLMTMMGGVELFAQSADKPADAAPAGSKVRLAVIGCGAWGREVLKMLGSQKLSEVAALCDIYEPAMRKCSTDAPGVKLVADYNELLADKTIKAVIIATPTHQHRDIALAAIKAGKHVYCEAPLAHTIEDARDIARAAKAAPKQIFQSGLQMRSDKQRLFLMPFISSGSLGNWVMARAQWHRMESWRASSSNPERALAINWRLSRATSLGLMGEVGIHQLDQVGWFLKSRPKAVTGFGSLVQWKDDGRDVADTIQAVFEFPKGVRYSYDATLANSFETDYETYSGSYAAVMMRGSKAWMFKEVDSPLFGWEVYAKKEEFQNATGITLMVGASKQESFTAKPSAEAILAATPIYQALGNFLKNVYEQDAKIQSFVESYGEPDTPELDSQLMAELEKETVSRRAKFASANDGFHATVTAIKANEAIVTGQRIELKDEWYQL